MKHLHETQEGAFYLKKLRRSREKHKCRSGQNLNIIN